MNVTGEVLVLVLGQLFTAAGVYAAIRADLREALVEVRSLKERVRNLERKAP